MKHLILIAALGFLNLNLFAQDLKWENADDNNSDKRKSKVETALNQSNDADLAPYRINIREGMLSMSQGSNYGYSFVLPDLSEKEAKSLWKDLLKEYDSKPKKVKKSDDMMAADVRVSAITGAGSMNVYSQTEGRGKDVAMTVWFEMSEGKFLNSRDYPNSAGEGEGFIEKFGVRAKKAAIKKELKAEEKELEKLSKDLKNLAKKKANLEKDIENFKKKILAAEQAIVENEAAQAETENIISEQQTKVQEVNHRLNSTH